MAGLRFAPLLILAPLMLVACQKQSDSGDEALSDAAAHATQVKCALAGAATFDDGCSVDRKVSGDGLMLMIHHPDGGFRRLVVTTDGRGVVTADGSDAATVSVVDPATIEVTVGQDRYRLPATVKGQALPAK
jgi:hypothetical protein